jgi:spore germination cell wall hydrolase CwlJ-like protein
MASARFSRPRFSWAAGVFAPWWLGLVFAVSISADAGQDAASGASISPLSARAPLPPDTLVPHSVSIAASGDFGRLTGEALRLLRNASLVLQDAYDTKRLSDEFEPRAVPRRGGGPLPVIDRRAKGDPVVGLRPTFDARLRQPGALARLRLHDALFTHDETSPVGGFAELEGEAETDESSSGFEPWPEGESPTTLPSSAETSPQRPGGATMTMRPAAINERLMQGATPVLRRAEVLASMTPARTESTPIEVVAHAAVPPTLPASVPRESASRTRTSFAATAGRDETDKEKRCLAEAIYFEARGESEQGQAAVAQVVLNRVSSGLYPATICGVVYQNRHRFHACQFSFACDGRSLRVSDPASWRTAVRIATEVTDGKVYVSDVGASTHYHADYVRPRWARRLEKMDVIGHHIFYKLQPGQN